MQRRTQQSSSEESNPSQVSSQCIQSTQSRVSSTIENTQAEDSSRSVQEFRDNSSHPPLWTSSDRQNPRDATRDRHRRKRRLEKAINLSLEQLRDLLQFIYANDDRVQGIRWTPGMLFTYVPLEFETAVVTESVAKSVLETAIFHALESHFPS